MFENINPIAPLALVLLLIGVMAAKEIKRTLRRRNARMASAERYAQRLEEWVERGYNNVNLRPNNACFNRTEQVKQVTRSPINPPNPRALNFLLTIQPVEGQAPSKVHESSTAIEIEAGPFVKGLLSAI